MNGEWNENQHVIDASLHRKNGGGGGMDGDVNVLTKKSLYSNLIRKVELQENGIHPKHTRKNAAET